MNEVVADNASEIMREARNVVETDLIPDYTEFRRVLKAKRKGWLYTVLDPVVELLQIDAAPWTPRFYGQILKALGVPGLSKLDEKTLSNETLAYHFMRKVEEAA